MCVFLCVFVCARRRWAFEGGSMSAEDRYALALTGERARLSIADKGAFLCVHACVFVCVCVCVWVCVRAHAQ